MYHFNVAMLIDLLQHTSPWALCLIFTAVASVVLWGMTRWAEWLVVLASTAIYAIPTIICAMH